MRKHFGRPGRTVTRLVTMLLLAVVVAFSSSLARAARPSPRESLESLPATNPYRRALIMLESLPEPDREALEEWARPDSQDVQRPPLDQNQMEVARALATELRAAASAPKLDASAWPLLGDPARPHDPPMQSAAGYRSLRDLSRIAVKVADASPPGEAVETYAAVAQLGRQQRAGVTLLEQMIGVFVENVAFAGATQRFTDYSADDLRRLADTWAALHEAPDNRQALEGEQQHVFGVYLERIVEPGLRRLLEDPHAGEEKEASGGDEIPVLKDHRLSGLIDLGGGDYRISLEHVPSGRHLSLEMDRESDGLRLIEVDIAGHRAVIRRGDLELMVPLQSRRVRAPSEAARELRQMVSGLDPKDESVGQRHLAEMLKLARAHPDGVIGYISDLKQTYATEIERRTVSADLPDAAAAEAPPTPDLDPFIAMALPAFSKVLRNFNKLSTQPLMLRAAVHHRLAQLGALQEEDTPPADPWSETGAAFTVESNTTGNGFTLRSRYELKPGEALTATFGPPPVVRPPEAKSVPSSPSR